MAKIKSGNGSAHGRIEGMCQALKEKDVELASKIESLNSEVVGLRSRGVHNYLETCSSVARAVPELPPLGYVYVMVL